MKIYARQISPEYQESPLFLNEDCFPEDIAVFGNRNYNEHLPDVVRRVRDVLEAGELADVLENINEWRQWYKNTAEAVKDYLPAENGRAYTTMDIHRLKVGVIGYSEARRSQEETEMLCYTLSVVTGQEWSSRCIRGSCQSEWNTVYYPVEQWSREALYTFEVEYFNMGSEWIIHDEEWRPETPDEITGYSVYCTSWDDAGIRNELASSAGCKPDEIIMYSYGGSRSVPIYQEVKV